MTLSEVLLVTGMALVTLAIRYPLLAVSGRLTMPSRLLAALRYVPPAVLTAIVVPAVLAPAHELWLSLANPRLVGALVALGVGLWRQNLLLTLATGMGAFFLGQMVGLIE